MPTPEEIADLEDAVQEISEALQGVTAQATWDQDVMGPPLLGPARVGLALSISNGRNPVEAAEAMLDILIRKGADDFVMSVEDRATEEIYLVYRGQVITPEQAADLFGTINEDEDEDEDEGEDDAADGDT